MNVNLLEDIGLTKSQAKAYAALVEQRSATAPDTASSIGESRTNAYKVLDKLCELGLASKDRSGKKVVYYPASPAALEQFAKRETIRMQLRERKLKAAMPDFMNFFTAHSEQPGVSFYQGKEGLRRIYDDQTKTNKPIYYVRSMEDAKFFDMPEMHIIRNTLAQHGVARYAIIQDDYPRAEVPENERTPIAESDKAMHLTRTWIDPEDYTDPVEWAAYGDKLSIISYGKEAVGLVIESPQIAKAFRRLFELLDEGLRRRPGYDMRPLRFTYTGMPDSLRKKSSDKTLRR